MDYNIESNIIKLHGSKEIIIKTLRLLGIESPIDSERLLSFLLSNPAFLESDELIDSEDIVEDEDGDELNAFLPTKRHFYINVKVTTIVLAALILDITLTKGIASTSLSLSGMSAQAIALILEINGQMCIIKETLMTQDRSGTKNILTKNKGLCFNNDLDCRFRSESICNCKPDDVEEIYKTLCSKNVFKERGDSYRYQW